MANRHDNGAPSEAVSTPMQPPSLQELCTKKALDELFDSDSEDVDIASLEPRLQQLLFRRLRQEITRLRNVERHWERVATRAPSLDLEILRSLDRYVASKDDTSSEDEAYSKAVSFQSMWAYEREDEDHPNEGSFDTFFNTSNLFSDAPLSDMKICDHGEEICITCMSARECVFSQRISSQLLLYRLSVTFGMPPPRETGGPETCWDIALKHVDDGGVLSFSEYEGRAEVQFEGSNSAEEDALKLINYLVGMKCYHTDPEHNDPGIVAGMAA